MKKVEVSSENYQRCNEITSEINDLLKELKNDTAMFSTSNHIFRHANFSKLTDMGVRIVPYLIHIILEYGSDWILLHLLQQITKERPYDKEEVGRFGIMTAKWLLWYETCKYKAEDVYYGLLTQDEK